MRAVKARQAVEDGPLREVVRGEADVDVLVDLDEQERQTQEKRREDPGLQREAVVRLHAVLRPVQRERRRHEDAGVHAGHRHGQLVPVDREPLVAVHDADEEVGREERAEHHDLADDEKHHPEQLGLDPGALIRRRRAVVVVVGRVPVGDARRFHAQASTAALASTCSTGLLVARRTREMRSARSQPERVAGSVEITMSSTRNNCSAFMVAVYGSGSPIMPAQTMPPERRRSSTWPRRPRAAWAAVPPPPSWGTQTMYRRSRPSSPALARRRSRRLSPAAVRLATTSVTSKGRPSLSRYVMTCVTGRPVAPPTRAIRSRRIQPEDVAG